MTNKRTYYPYRTIKRNMEPCGIDLMEIKKTGVRYFESGNAVSKTYVALKAFCLGEKRDDVLVYGSWDELVVFVSE